MKVRIKELITDEDGKERNENELPFTNEKQKNYKKKLLRIAEVKEILRN